MCKSERKLSYYKTLNRMHLIPICVLVLLMVIIVIGIIFQNMYISPYTSLLQTSFVTKENKYNKVRNMKLRNRPFFKSIVISNNCFSKATTFSIIGLQSLRTISVGSNSFTQHPNGFGNDINKSFQVLNCESLESIEIGEYSFSDYGGQFELSNLPQLQSIQIGQLNSSSYNFYSTPLNIQGIELIY